MLVILKAIWRPVKSASVRFSPYQHGVYSILHIILLGLVDDSDRLEG